MICSPCRDQVHQFCPEDYRQRTADGSVLAYIERLASSLCDCQHGDSQVPPLHVCASPWGCYGADCAGNGLPAVR